MSDFLREIAPSLVEIALPILLALATAGATWLGARLNTLLGVQIETELNAAFNAVLSRAAADVVRRYRITPGAPAGGATTEVVASMMRTNPDLMARLKLDPSSRALEGVAARAIRAASEAADAPHVIP